MPSYAGLIFINALRHSSSPPGHLTSTETAYVLCIAGIGLVILLAAGLHQRFVSGK